MRKILFKARRLDNGEWVEGFVFQLYSESTWCIGNEALYPNDYSEIIGENRDWFRIDENTICQYTGLTDKNGKRIWENDICYYDDMDMCVIRFGEYDNNTGHKHIGFYTDWQKYKELYRHDLGFWVAEREVEVIGNIFDNTELVGCE